MFVLCKLEKRAETTDTLLIVCASSQQILEELLLSLFDELYDREMEIAAKEEDYVSEEKIRAWCIKMMEYYQIVQVPIIM